MIYLFTILFTALFIGYQKFQFQDLKYIRNTKWKLYGWLMKAELIAACYVMQFFSCTWQDCLLSGVLNWITFEFAYNKIVLKTGWFYVGASSIQDNKLGKWKWAVMGVCLIISVILKILSHG